MLNIRKKQYLLAAVIASISTTTFSKEISYDYIQGTYGSITIDTGTTAGDLNGDGVSASGSFSIAPIVAITAGVGASSFDRLQGIKIDTTSIDFGVTIHTSIAPGTDVYGNFSAIKGKIEVNDGFTTADDSDTGNTIAAGLRYLASDKVELDAEYSRTDLFDDKSNTLFLAARFYASEKFSLAAGYSTGDDVETLLLNARLDFK